MALIHCDFFSEALGLSSSMYVILPQTTTGQIGMDSVRTKEKLPTLYLLHGLSDDHSIWLRRTSIERYVSELGIAVVMPAVGRSFYADMENGLRYWTFISEELPAIARSFFPLSEAREDNFTAGLSMGGYGAFKLALSHPDRFAAGASLSGAVDMLQHFRIDSPLSPKEWLNIFGSEEVFSGGPNDLFHLAEEVARREGAKPKLFQCCGTEDFLYEDNQHFLKHARSLNLDLVYEEEPGTHNWEYWDMKIQRVLEWLPLTR
ncbi:alpha/beta hydrolase [Gorillibacterium massiliense]|uniref:alpha/beta hydrolase n=1 Tax=Gorillibacterium massiliense TaxID=1280390 RepID=UPI0004BCC257|nr:alpha/beta hydrolase family protein [Gorillibacterium massiliense]